MKPAPPASRKKKRNVVKVGIVTIPWRRFSDGRTCIDLRSLGLKRRTFTDHAEAIAEAERIARERHNGGADAAPITAEQRVTLAKLLSAAGELAIDPAAVINAGAAALRRPVHKTIDIAFELLASKDARDLNKRYRRGLTSDVQAFAAMYPHELPAEPRQIDAFIATIPHGARRKNAALWSVRHLYSFAKKRNYYPSDKTDPAQQVELAEQPITRIEIFAVWEMELYLAHARETFVPWLACNSFSGARHEEIVLARDAAKKKDPIRWEDFDWDDRAIAIRPETSKTGRARRIPILDNLFEILKPWRDRKATGPICSAHPGDYETRRIVARANKELAAQHDTRRLAWKKNAPRHSYCSYRMAIVQNEHQVAYESGHSVAMIRKHYHNPRPKSEAAAWFKLQRATPGNIIQLEIFNAA